MIRRWSFLALGLVVMAIQLASPVLLLAHSHEEHAGHEQRESSSDSSKCQICHIIGSLKNIDTPAPLLAIDAGHILCGAVPSGEDAAPSVTVHRAAQPRAPPAV